MQRRVEQWERAAAVAVGGAVAVWAVSTAIQRRGPGRRGPTADLAHGVELKESVTIRRPVAEVYAFWQHPGNLPRFMRHVEHVRELGGGRTHWVLREPGGVRLEWDAEITESIDNRLLAWRSLPGADVATIGSVTFRPRGTTAAEITVQLRYRAPGGRAAAALAWLSGDAPASQLREDLRRLKSLLETGEAPTTAGQPAGRRHVINLAQWVDA